MLSVYKFAEGFSFLKAKTQLKGIIDVVGIVLFAGDYFQRACGALDRAGAGDNLKFSLDHLYLVTIIVVLLV